MAKKKDKLVEELSTDYVQDTKLMDEVLPMYEVVVAFKADYLGHKIDAKVGDMIELDDYEYMKFKDKVK